ncbi:hypothetical protein QLX08_004462 [Tetragonisca angustula]|uniref:MICOS complex subunit MIC13 n=1 Tax=Tetragonisca angustula TaxID=166442 RepID=A0AAW1A2G8_9HYME
MKRGTKCVVQTINLSNPETCIRPKRIQKLVQAEVMQPCPSIAASGPSYWTPRPVPIKICTRRDMQRTCPPKLCDCPQKALPKSPGQKLCKFLLFLLKSGIVAGLFCWTNYEGLWGSSSDVEDLYRRIVATIVPALDQKEIELPSVNKFKHTMIQKYNHAVFTIMNCIVNTSTMLRKQLQSILLDEPIGVEPSGAKSSDDSMDTEEEI